MTFTIRAACATGLLVLGFIPALVSSAQAPTRSAATTAAARRLPEPSAPPSQVGVPEDTDAGQASDSKKTRKSVFAEDGPVDTAWDAQLESFWHAVVRLPVAAALSAILAFRPRRRGTPKRQAPVIQTQIVLALVGAMVMMVVGASLARAFGIVGAAGLIRYRAKVEDPKDAGVMLSTLAIGLASGVGLYVFAVFATGFVLAVLLVIESIDPDPYLLFNLTIATPDSAGLKDQIEGVFRRRRIPYELRSTAADQICYEVKLPLTLHTDTLSEALVSLQPAKTVDVKWEEKKGTK